MIKSNLINCRGPAQRAWAGPYRSRRRMLQLAGKEYMSDAGQGLERVRRRCITNLMSNSLGKAENRTWNAKQVVTLSFILPPTEGFLLPSLCDLTLSLSLSFRLGANWRNKIKHVLGAVTLSLLEISPFEKLTAGYQFEHVSKHLDVWQLNVSYVSYCWVVIVILSMTTGCHKLLFHCVIRF